MQQGIYDQIEAFTKTYFYMQSMYISNVHSAKINTILNYLFSQACLFEKVHNNYWIIEIIHRLKTNGIILEADVEVRGVDVKIVFKPIIDDPLTVKFKNNLTDTEVQYLWDNTIRGS